MNRKVYAYWYEGKPLYHWCKENDVSYFRVMEILYKRKDLNIEESIKYVKEHRGKKVKYQINGVSVRKLLGDYKYTLFNGAVSRNRERGKNVPWEEVYKKLSTV